MASLIRFLCVSVLLSISAQTTAQSDWSNSRNKASRELAKSLNSELKGSETILRGSIHRNPMTYYRYKGEMYYYAHSPEHSGLFRLENDEAVTINSVKANGDKITLELTNSQNEKGLVWFAAPLYSLPLDREGFDKGYTLCFKTEDEPVSVPSVIGNVESNMFHVGTCNHLPDPANRVSFATRSSAEKAGYRECKLCFMDLPVDSFPDERTTDEREMAIEREMGRRAFEQILDTGLVSDDSVLIGRVERIGHLVLSNWPQDLRGFRYRFGVLELNGVNASSLPGGYVFINRGLLEVVESRLELEAILAHEIAHVELKHGYRIFIENEKKEAFASILSAGIAILAAGVLGDGVGDLGASAIIGGSVLLARLAIESVYARFPRSMEEEADSAARDYLILNHSDRGLAEMGRVLRKLSYYMNYFGEDKNETTAFATHPQIENRIMFFEKVRYRFSDRGIRFVGTAEQGEEKISIEVLSETWYDSPEIANRLSVPQYSINARVDSDYRFIVPSVKQIVITTSEGAQSELNPVDDDIDIFDDMEESEQDKTLALHGNLPGELGTFEIKTIHVFFHQLSSESRSPSPRIYRRVRELKSLGILPSSDDEQALRKLKWQFVNDSVD